MAVYRRMFTIPDVGDTHAQYILAVRTFEAVERAAEQVGRPGLAVGTIRALKESYALFNRQLDELAVTTAADAKARIIGILKLRQKRPNTAMGPHLRGAIICRPIRDFGSLGTGEVGIADIASLDRVVNPFGPQYGPYWRAIEEGTRKHVNRRVVGAFFGAGLGSGPFAPDPGQFRRHPVFVTSAQGGAAFGGVGFGGGFGPQGGQGGRRMTIRRAIDPQHFIRDGANLAERRWRSELALIIARAERRLTVFAP